MVKGDHTRYHEALINSIAKLWAKSNEQCDSKDSPDSPWQSALWRKLIGETGANSQQHRAYLHQTFISATQATDRRPAALPETIHVFGLSSLPAIHMQTLQAVSGFLDVNIYYI